MDTNNRCNRHREHRYSGRGGFRFPILLIVVGILFLVVNTGIIPTIYKPLFESWPLWVFFGGVFFLIQRSWFMSVALLTLGTFYLIPQIGLANPALQIPANFTKVYWPALLVIAGIYIVLSSLLCPKRSCSRKYFDHTDITTSHVNTEDGFLYIKSGFDSRRHIVMDPVLKGGYIETGFGEVVVDLRKTKLAEGKTYLKIHVSFGSAQLIVPSDWNVSIVGDSAFGSFVDARMSPIYNSESNSTLVIEGKCSFGECRIRD
jgi:predicted membrane protein